MLFSYAPYYDQKHGSCAAKVEKYLAKYESSGNLKDLFGAYHQNILLIGEQVKRIPGESVANRHTRILGLMRGSLEGLSMSDDPESVSLVGMWDDASHIVDTDSYDSWVTNVQRELVKKIVPDLGTKGEEDVLELLNVLKIFDIRRIETLRSLQVGGLVECSGYRGDISGTYWYESGDWSRLESLSQFKEGDTLGERVASYYKESQWFSVPYSCRIIGMTDLPQDI